MQKRLAYSVFLWTHRWFGLVAGLYFVLFGVTGSYLVYDNAIDVWLYPERFVAESTAANIDLPQLISIAQTGLKTDKSPTRVTIPESGTQNAQIQFNMADAGQAPKPVVAYVDPSNGSFKGGFARLESIGGLMSVFHHDLFLGAAVGRFWMGISGVILMILLLSGLWIWWPKTRLLGKSLKWPTLRSLYKASLDLHKLFGIYTLILMIAVTFSGLYISVPGWFQFGKDGGGPRGGGGPGAPAEIPALDYSVLQQQLAAQNLLQRPLMVAYNAREKGFVVRSAADKPILAYDPATATLTEKVDAAKSFEMRRLQREIHGGEYWGIWGGILTFISGLLPLFFFITGFYVWWKKRGLQAKRSLAA